MEQEIPILDYEPLEKSVARLSEGKICYEVVPQDCETKAEATLYWDKEKHKWLAEVSGEFLESSWDKDTGGPLYLSFSHYARGLNQSACKKLLEAYGIDPSKVNLSDIPELAPSRLETMAGMNSK